LNLHRYRGWNRSGLQKQPQRLLPTLQMFIWKECLILQLNHLSSTEILCLFSLDLPALLKIVFVSHYVLFCLLLDILLNLFQPIFDIVERLSVSHIIYNNDAISSSVVAAGDCPETILPSCIPLRQQKSTICTLTFIPLHLIYLILWINSYLRNQLRWCCNSYVRTFYHYTVKELNFCLLQSCQ